jgi:tRNA1(Val) A37 N6-methylase TrmN6
VSAGLAVTRDTLFGGRVPLLQPARGSGYRTNVDAILLAAFAGEGKRPARLAVDLGAGVGAVALSLAYLGYAQKLALVERDPDLVRLARSNLLESGVADLSTVHQGDLNDPLRTIAPGLLHRADLVVCNPPYVSPPRDGRPPKGPGATARAESRRGDLHPFMRAAADALGARSRACFVYPAQELVDLFALAREVELEPKRMRMVHGRQGRPARVALVELARGRRGGLSVQQALIETDARGRPSEELSALLAQ